ncbi:DUF6894 family protein [Methylobacterium planeticum]|uniref:DUF6894 domain-containing protein n=1 Tax=Methylobacterium planeticum TaxID=2615211 RepID=A0A6N6MLT8_9HYPH|nr:hypothetical protein [Methylobacterium planeticum]KAB1071652.1 hypothetical protein F6X51_19005 [Methylobacterium planeticum]
MPRYFLDIHDGRFILDDIGSDLADLTEVRAEVKRVLGDLVRHLDFEDDPYRLRIDVRDADGRRVLTGRLVMVVEDAV